MIIFFNKVKYRLLKTIVRSFVFIVYKLKLELITKKEFLKHNLLLLRKSYYLPIPGANDYKYIKPTKLVGINIDEKGCSKFFKDVIQKYKNEFTGFKLYQVKGEDFFLINGSFMTMDAHTYYSLVRHFKPKKIIEIGSGYSTFVCAKAIARNKADSNDPDTEYFCVDPYPKKELKFQLSKKTHLIRKSVQDVDPSFFEALKENDILFIDSTHTFRAGGDVSYLYCEILPRLSPGVIIHIHDIELPKPYPEVYFSNDWYWTEQYLLQALLAHTKRYSILWPAAYMCSKFPKLLTKNFTKEYAAEKRMYDYASPSSFWMKVMKSN